MPSFDSHPIETLMSALTFVMWLGTLAPMAMLATYTWWGHDEHARIPRASVVRLR